MHSLGVGCSAGFFLLIEAGDFFPKCHFRSFLLIFALEISSLNEQQEMKFLQGPQMLSVVWIRDLKFIRTGTELLLNDLGGAKTKYIY